MHLTFLWLGGLLRRRARVILPMSAGVALTVALLASLGMFLSSAQASMTGRAIATVTVDWQVEVQPGFNATTVAREVRGDPNVVKSAVVHAATTTGFEHTSGSTTQTTGPGQVLGIPATYRRLFSEQIRSLTGDATAKSSSGALLYQQTAANLGVQPGDTVSVRRTGMAPATVTIAAIVDLPQSDSLFQHVGAPVGAQPQAPPDNVLLLPSHQWHRLFDPVATARPDQVRTQIHTQTRHTGLPPNPIAAYTDATGRAHNLEVRLAGAGLVGDNLGAALGAARSDALYARMLFLFLGVPGAFLAAAVTVTSAGASRVQRRRDQALLRARGATTDQLSMFGVVEAMLVGALGGAVGLLLAVAASRWILGAQLDSGLVDGNLIWPAAAVCTALAVTTCSIAVPAHLDARRLTVNAARRSVGRSSPVPWWMRWWIDLGLLALAGAIFWDTTRTGYELVLAPEGVPTIAVSYWAFAGPALVWAGGALLIYRLVDLLLRRGRRPVAAVLRAFGGQLGDLAAATVQRQHHRVSLGAALVALATTFAVSTAVFNTTYERQADIDAVLTNGADVTVTISPGTVATSASPTARRIANIQGVRSVEPLQHRYAYVGSDLQDLYGVRPSTIVRAGRLQDAYFEGGTAKGLIALLADKRDSILVSAETVRDFQLQPGDLLRLRLQNGVTKQNVVVPFHYVGVVKEFPTAPSDSFLLANADYVARATGSAAVGAFLLDTGGRMVPDVARRARREVEQVAAVSDIVSSRRIVGSSLTAVDLRGLTRLELAFALAVVVASAGLSLWLGLDQRRRTYAIASALGARSRDLAGFILAEVLIVAVAGITLGAVLASALSAMLVKVLQGVFDPPPDRLAIPIAYLLVVFMLTLGSAATAAWLTLRTVREPDLELLRSHG